MILEMLVDQALAEVTKRIIKDPGKPIVCIRAASVDDGGELKEQPSVLVVIAVGTQEGVVESTDKVKIILDEVFNKLYGKPDNPVM